MGNMAFRAASEDLESIMLTLPQSDCPVRHVFSPGIYLREMRIPKGTLLTGKVHLHQHLCVMHGDLGVIDEYGKRRLTGYHCFQSLPGAKRVGVAYEDTVFSTIHSTNETDIATLERTLFFDNYELLHEHIRTIDFISIANHDYNDFIVEIGLNECEINRIVKNTTDQIQMPTTIESIEIKPSKINGLGMFATRRIEMGDAIAPARLRGCRTPAGRYVNHAPIPYANTYFMPLDNGDLILMADRNIEPGDELTIDYRQAMSVNGNLSLIQEHK